MLLAVVQGIAQIYSNNYIQNDIFSAHGDSANELTDVFNEINYGYTRITQNDSLEVFSQNLPYEVKKEEFVKIIRNSALSEDYLNVALCLNGEYFSLDDDFDMPKKAFTNKLVNGGNKLILGEIDAQKGYITVGRRFSSVAFNLEGYAVFYLSQARLFKIASLANPGNGVSRIVDSDYRIIASSDNSGVGATVFEKDKIKLGKNDTYRENYNGRLTFMAVSVIENQYDMGLCVVSEISVLELQKDYIVINIVLASIAVVALGASIIVSIYLARRTAKPIKGLSQELANVDFSSGHSSFSIGTDGDEIYELEKSYNDMLERLFALMEENKQNMETQRKLEIDALQMQINPHFLYNTLDAIAWMSKIKKQPEIEKLVMNLAKFFRLSLHKGEKYVTISEEAELVEHFLEIEKIRFPNTIRYVRDIPEEIEGYTTIKLILQPIVENSIKHGFQQKEGIGTITVKAREEGDDILISVSDDGEGFDMPQDFWTRKADSPNGYGLRNVNERIRLEYGEGYGLCINTQIGKGTEVVARIKKSL